jgi:hypothetical protein
MNRSAIAIFARQLLVVALPLIVGSGVGTLAFFVQQQELLPAFFYPLLFPLLAGALAGYLTLWLVLQRHSCVTMPMVAALALAATFVVLATETGWAYRTYVRSARAAVHQSPLGQLAQSAEGGELFRPAPLSQFVAAQIERSRGWWWIDAAMLGSGTVIGGAIAASTRHKVSLT